MIQNPQEIYQRYEERFKELSAYIYASDWEGDMLLLKWWMKLTETGDLENIINPDSHRLGAFLNVFAPPTITFYALNPSTGNIEFVFWLKNPSPADKTVFVGFWADEELRGSRRLIKLSRLVYELSFEFYSAVLGFTWQFELLDIHLKLGYKVVGNIPDFLGHETTWIVRLTLEDFQNSRFMKAAQRLERRD